MRQTARRWNGRAQWSAEDERAARGDTRSPVLQMQVQLYICISVLPAIDP
jgi:hypothetical protein